MGCWYMKVSKSVDGWSLWKSNSMGGRVQKSAVLTPHVFVSGIALNTFDFEGRMWDLIVSVPHHYLSFYLTFSFCSSWVLLQLFSPEKWQNVLLIAPWL